MTENETVELPGEPDLAGDGYSPHSNVALSVAITFAVPASVTALDFHGLKDLFRL